MGLFMAAVEADYISCPFAHCLDNLIQIDLFFFLQSCNYTKTNLHRQTVQLRLKDFQFYDA